MGDALRGALDSQIALFRENICPVGANFQRNFSFNGVVDIWIQERTVTHWHGEFGAALEKKCKQMRMFCGWKPHSKCT